MKQYIGQRTDKEFCERNLVLVNGKELKHYVMHSPDGFEWGYGGSGPSELSRCILIDYFGSISEANKYYQKFKCDVISKIKGISWVITSDDIKNWLINNNENNQL